MNQFFYQEGNALFDDILNTFYYWLYGIYHSDSKRGNPLLLHGLLFPMSSKDYFNVPYHRQDNTYLALSSIIYYVGN